MPIIFAVCWLEVSVPSAVESKAIRKIVLVLDLPTTFPIQRWSLIQLIVLGGGGG